MAPAWKGHTGYHGSSGMCPRPCCHFGVGEWDRAAPDESVAHSKGPNKTEAGSLKGALADKAAGNLEGGDGGGCGMGERAADPRVVDAGVSCIGKAWWQ